MPGWFPELNEVVLFAPEEGWLWFRQPKGVVTATRLEEVIPALEEIERQVEREGRYAAGFIAYEAAPAFEPALQVKEVTQQGSGVPLMWFGLYEAPVKLAKEYLGGGEVKLPAGWQADVSEEVYRHAIRKVKGWIAHGETYQVNYTYRLRTDWDGNPWPLFAALANAHVAPYAAFIETAEWAVCSISPELFYRQEGDLLTSKPMKGTARRGLTLADDQKQAKWLYHSEKNRAENVMIVDMVRNDMGRIARVGSVRVPRLFEVEKYPTVWQITSTVQAESRAGMVEVLKALFPAASITGAPKVRTMQIIAGLEASPRGIYTGAVGYFAPGRRAQLNVAIRTLWMDKKEGKAVYGVGGGIVWDSTPGDEWQETKTKARILNELPRGFELIETLRWTPEEGWFLVGQHLWRLGRSAEYFAYPYDEQAVREALEAAAGTFGDKPQRVRLTLDREVGICLESKPLDLQGANPQRVGLAKTKVNSADRFLYHKTTRREVYERARGERPDVDETLLWNEKSELTEACIANLVVELDGQLYTPPVKCGLLAGTYRAWLLEQGKVKERIIRVEELERCERIFLANSVRGMWEVEIVL
jgi:para-aminobenzoate synthetase/4-amino-4-deoxychorismate lyase